MYYRMADFNLNIAGSKHKWLDGGRTDTRLDTLSFWRDL